MRSSAVLCAVALGLLAVALTVSASEEKSPKVNVYTRNPVEFGVENELICHCSGFHPPRLTMNLKQGSKVMDDCKDSDLSFEQDWTYHKMRFAKFTPREGEEYVCEVSHNEGKPQTFKLEIF